MKLFQQVGCFKQGPSLAIAGASDAAYLALMGLLTWLGLKKPPERVAKHLLLTRYNIAFTAAQKAGVEGLSDDYLVPRGELFRRYCVPSVQSQTNKNFEWFVFFHPDTPKQHYEFLDGIATVVLAQTLKEAQHTIARTLPEGPILSTRMDNDDCIAPEFMAATRKTAERALATQPGDFVVTPQHGAVMSLVHGTWGFHTLESPPFISLLWRPVQGKQWRSPLNFNHMHHGGLPLVPVIHDGPLWLAIIHEQNILQRWKKSRGNMKIASLEKLFPALIDNRPPNHALRLAGTTKSAARSD